ncbi:tubulin-like doman-containing protein [Paenibacillus sp. MBLB4367]|uniref:tubulin-like doman-containing protein n=1 Tax=Paenibacillus sp. MBLB4367 TaxID=3384767 RepID=UPI003907EFE4
MKAVVREHIQQLDVSLGGGIVSDKIRVDTIDNPMLIIGLGGTGIDALLRLKYQINRRFKLPEDSVSKKRREKPDKVEFLAFETNEHDRNKKYRGIGLDPISEFVLLSNAEVGSLLQNRSILEPYITEWLSPELNVTDGINGAQGVRQAGRLLLFTKINQVVQTIERKIKSLCEGTNKKLYVFVLTGLSGGTGSGCFLDISYIVRGIIEREHGSAGVDRVSMLGYLFTPDVNLSNKSLTAHTSEYIKKNGYAALKELDYWMNTDERNERFRQRYGSVLEVNSIMPPFNLCHLISATNLEGKPLENAYDYCMNVTAENITNFMASEEKHSGEEFAIHDYISNINMNINQMPKPYPANYKYNIIGASSAVLPIEEMTTYLAYRLFKKMENMFASMPSQDETEKLVRKLGLDPDSVHRKFEERVPEPLPGYENSERLSYNNVIKQQIVNIDMELEQGFVARAKEEYVKTKKQAPAHVLEQFSDQMKRIFMNPAQGPFFASRIIYSQKGYCLLNMISTYIESLQESMDRSRRAIESAKEQANEKLTDARSAFISKDKKKNAYIEAKINQYLLVADMERAEQMLEFYDDVRNLLREQNLRIYEVFTEILNALNQIFEKNGDILTSSQESVDHKGNKTYYWNIVSVPDIAKVVGSIMDGKNVDELTRDFAAELLEHSNRWVKEQEIDIIGSISDFLSDKFGDLITKSMEDFLTIKYGDDQSIEKIIETQIAKKLDDESIPVFHLSNSSGNMHFPSWGFVSVPLKAPNILKGIKNYQNTAISNSRFTVKESEVKNRIFWLNTKNGIPLFTYTPLRVYEDSYERTILEKEGVGRHLRQTDKDNWTYLPSPIPEKSWGDMYLNPRIKAYNAQLRELFDLALKYQCIVEKKSDYSMSNLFECVFTKPFQVEPFVARYNMQLQEQRPNLGEIKRCINDLKALLEQGLDKEASRDIFASSNTEVATDNFIRSPELVKRIREEVNKYTAIEAQIAVLDAVLSGYQDEEKLLDQFIEAMYTGTIVKRGAVYVYDRSDEEDDWEPFVNLTKVNKYVEFTIFDHFRKLDAKRKAMIARKSERRNQDMVASEEKVAELVRKLDEMGVSMGEARSNLEFSRDELVNGEEVYGFYRKAAAKVNELSRNLK